jgi:hypothetical protein
MCTQQQKLETTVFPGWELKWRKVSWRERVHMWWLIQISNKDTANRLPKLRVRIANKINY